MIYKWGLPNSNTKKHPNRFNKRKILATPYSKQNPSNSICETIQKWWQINEPKWFSISPSFFTNVGKKISGVIYIFKILLAFYFKLKSHWNQLINWFQILPSFIKCWKLHMGLEIFQITPHSCLAIFFEFVGAKTK